MLKKTIQELKREVCNSTDLRPECRQKMLHLIGRLEAVPMEDTAFELQKISVEFEVMHPKTVELANRICMMFSGIGI